MNFENIIGNEKIKEILINSIKEKNILHSYLFYGIDGIGKKMFANEFAKMILCNNNENIPCGKCKSCIEFQSNNNPDFFYIDSNDNSIKIEQIRNMQEKILEKPVNCEKKVYIINDADKMTKEAQNCLLKTLEEPQEFVVIILISSNENNILATVKSRCVQIYFKELYNQEIIEYLENVKHIDNMNDEFLQLCNGSIGRALEILDKNEMLDELRKFVETIEKLNELELLNNSEYFCKNKDNIKIILEYMYTLFFKKMQVNKEQKYANAMEYVENAKIKLINNNNFDMTIDNMLINIWEEINEKYNRN